MLDIEHNHEHAGCEAIDSEALLSIMIRNLMEVSLMKGFHLTKIDSERMIKDVNGL